VNITIGASVWVAARFDNEPGYDESTEFLLLAMGSRQTVVLPWLAIVECVAAVARKTNNPGLAKEVGAYVLGLPEVMWVTLDENAVREATKVASEHQLPAADAVYAAVARSHGATW
jgi:predicted nucleic acid-binding protein